jgi:PBSX family phage terminase large subunit
MQCLNCYTAEMMIPANSHPAYVECPNCGAIELTYEPMDYQEAIHEVPYKEFINKRGEPEIEPRIIFIAGGYGSGKSRSSLQEFFLTCLESPRGTGLITAPTLPQLKKTTIKTLLEEIIPPPLIETYNQTAGEIILINGFRIYVVPSDQEEKLRSLNVGVIHIEEASGIKESIYSQLTTRLRDPYVKYKTIFVCTNPDINWVKSTFVDNEARKDPNHPEHENYNPFISCHIWATKLNKFLPENFEQMIGAGRPEWWKERFLRGSFSHSSGMVYPNAAKSFVKSTEYGEIGDNWERVISMDWGARNPTAVLFGAIDQKNGELVIYQEYYVPNRLLPEHAKHLKPLIDEIPAGLIRTMVADPSIRNKNDVVNGKSVQGLFQEYGMYFREGNNNIEGGLLRVNSYIERGKLKIFTDKCPNLSREIIGYKFPELSLDDSDKNLDEKPIKAKDHSVDSLRYMLMTLPEDSNLLKLVAFEPKMTYNTPIKVENEYGWDDDYANQYNGSFLQYV